jgi:nickel/cobalt transporter (NicO) family protein
VPASRYRSISPGRLPARRLRGGRLTAVLVAAAALVALSLAAPGAARAHPLGNFTINRYAGIELSGGRVYVHYALDLAEIPAFQEGGAVRAPDYANAVEDRFELLLDGRRVRLMPLEHRVADRPGAGGLKTLRFDAVYAGEGRGTRLVFRDRNYAERIGWREVTVSARDGARVVDSTAPAPSESNELRSYPKDLLRSPLDVTSAEANVAFGSGPGTPPRIDPSAQPMHRGGGFESLIEKGDLSVGIVLVSLLIAAFWGAAHALTPGHGKALVAGYLIGTKGRPRDAVLLGATVTVTHTAGVFGLGLVTLLLSQFIVPESLYPWLTLASGVLVVVVGASVLVQRIRSRGTPGHDHHHHGHDQADHQHGDDHHPHGHEHHHHCHGHHHHHGHSHDHGESVTSRGVVGVGVAAGLLPCPSALVVLLSAIALHRIGFGFALIAAFSLGLATTITGIGLVAVLARRAFSRVSLEGRVVQALPALSALVIMLVGVAITARAVPGVL